MPDFSLLTTPNFGQALVGGYQAGTAMRKDREREQALTGYLSNPDDEVSVTRLAAADPQLGIPLVKQRRETEQKRRIGELAQRASQGDHEAAMELWKADPDLAQRFDDRTRKMVEAGKEAVGNAALRIYALPEAQRAAAWDQSIEALSREYPELARFKGQYSPENLNGVLDQTGLTEKAMDLVAPKYQAIVPGGQLQNTNPLSPGFSAPPPAAPSPIQPGAVVNGKRFKGGDYRDPNNWEAGGPTPTASGGFPGQ